MSLKRLIDHDPLTGISTIWHGSPDGNTFSIEHTQDVEPILNDNKVKRDHVELNKKSEMWHAASIPAVVQMKWMVDYGVDVFNKDHAEKVKKLLNDPEWKYLRTKNFIL